MVLACLYCLCAASNEDENGGEHGEIDRSWGRPSFKGCRPFQQSTHSVVLASNRLLEQVFLSTWLSIPPTSLKHFLKIQSDNNRPRGFSWQLAHDNAFPSHIVRGRPPPKEVSQQAHNYATLVFYLRRREKKELYLTQEIVLCTYP